MVTVPEYVPTPRPAGLAVMLTLVDANAPAVALAEEAVSQRPPEVVAVATVTASEPPPAFEMESGRTPAAACWTNENVIDVGLTLRLGWPAAVTVNATAMVRVD